MSRLGGAIGTVVVVLLAVGIGGWWYFLRDDAPEAASLGDCKTSSGPSSPDGTWRVRAGDAADVFVGYRIKELFGGETIKKAAAGRTPEVEGDLKIDGAAVTGASFTADLSALVSNRTARDTSLHTKGLETDRFPNARFTLRGPIRLDGEPRPGEEVRATANGTLELHGQRRPVAIPIRACWTGPTIDVSGSAPVRLADYDIEAIDTPIVKIEDQGSLEFELTLVPG